VLHHCRILYPKPLGDAGKVDGGSVPRGDRSATGPYGRGPRRSATLRVFAAWRLGPAAPPGAGSCGRCGGPRESRPPGSARPPVGSSNASSRAFSLSKSPFKILSVPAGRTSAAARGVPAEGRRDHLRAWRPGAPARTTGAAPSRRPPVASSRAPLPAEHLLVNDHDVRGRIIASPGI